MRRRKRLTPGALEAILFTLFALLYWRWSLQTQVQQLQREERAQVTIYADNESQAERNYNVLRAARDNVLPPLPGTERWIRK